jgi:hypothetical protein
MSQVVRRALYGKLAGDSTLTNLLGSPPQNYSKAIYHLRAPEGAGFPYVVFNLQDSRPAYTMKPGVPGYNADLWLIKAVDANSTADRADSIIARVKALLTDSTLSISSEDLMLLVPESDVEYAELADGQEYRHAGVIFRLMHQPT